MQLAKLTSIERSCMLTPSFNKKDITQVVIRTLHEGFAKVVQLSYAFPLFVGGTGRVVNHEILLRPSASVVLGYDPYTDEVVLIEQLRSGLVACGAESPWLTEVVAGICEPDELPVYTAKRELFEETGIEATTFIPIASYWVSPGGSSERVHAFCALVDAKSASTYAGLAEEGENIAVKVISRLAYMQALAAGKIDNSAILLCAQWLALHADDIKHKIKQKETVDEWIYF